MIIRAMTSHYRSHPLQLVALALMIVVATMLWTGVSVLTGQARDSLAVSEASVAERASVVRDDGQPVSVTDFVTLRRAGVCVAPWLETSRGEPARRVIGIDPLAMACFGSSPGGDSAGLLNGDPFVDISEVAAGEGQLSLLIGSDTDALPPGYERKNFRLGPATGELADSFLLNLDALSVLVLLITGLLVRSVYHLGLAQRRGSFALLGRFGVRESRIQRLLAVELVLLTLVCVVPGVIFGQALARRLGQGFGQALGSLFDVSLYAGGNASELWRSVVIMIALVLGACLVDRVLPARLAKQGQRPGPASRRQWLMGLLLAAGLGLVAWAPSLIWVFAGTALVFAGVGGLAPGLLSWWADTMAGRRSMSPDSPLGRWRYRELAVMFRNLALPLVALQFAGATVLAVQALVTTFEDTFDTWLGQRLAAEFYVEVPDNVSGEAGARVLSELNGMGDWHWVRRTRAELQGIADDNSAGGNAAVTADVLALSPVSSLVTDWTLLASVEQPWAEVEAGAVMINEQLARRQGVRLGQRLRFEIDGQAMVAKVAAIYADYGRPSAELLIHGQALPKDLDPTFQSFSINAGTQSVEQVRTRLGTVWGTEDLVIRDNASLQALASQVFEQTFLLTRAISVLTLVLASLSLLVMGWVFFSTRVRYFQLLRVWGVSLARVRGQLRRLALLLVSGVTVVALPLGVCLTWVLVSRINPLAFGWSLPMAVYPGFWIELGVLMMLIGLSIAWLIGRQLDRPQSGSPVAGMSEGGDR
jgi:putative ABC transport system permease protein